jgi:hypothetical protein
MLRAIATLSLFLGILLPLDDAAAEAKPPTFSLPVQCSFPDECYIQAHVDLEPGPNSADHACGIITYNSHKGTDFRLRDLDLMDRGVPVVAAAAGTVIRTRDGVRDVHMKLFGKKLAFRRGAGNFVLIDHGGGWRTQYAHMRKGSVAVKSGMRIKSGQQLGLVGLSGLTEFPHMHFEINHSGQTIDPFVGKDNGNDCKGPKNTLWTGAALSVLKYRKYFLVAAGFADAPLSREALLYGLHVRDRLSRKAPAIAFHVDFSGGRMGDTYLLRIFGPGGKIFAENRKRLKKDAQIRFDLIGRKIAKRPAWPTGTYRGEFVLYRENAGKQSILLRHEQNLDVE